MKPIIKIAIPPNPHTTRCKSAACGAIIVWVVTENGKRMPVDLDGTAHWATCVDSKHFKEKAKLDARLAELKGGGG